VSLFVDHGVCLVGARRLCFVAGRGMCLIVGCGVTGYRRWGSGHRSEEGKRERDDGDVEDARAEGEDRHDIRVAVAQVDSVDSEDCDVKETAVPPNSTPSGRYTPMRCDALSTCAESSDTVLLSAVSSTSPFREISETHPARIL
jgi:hypothetical protein